MNQENEENEENQENLERLSYEEEQLQIILLRSLRDQLQLKKTELREYQDVEYQESLKVDLDREQDKGKDEIHTEVISLETISLEEMRDIRLRRFAK